MAGSRVIHLRTFTNAVSESLGLESELHQEMGPLENIPATYLIIRACNRITLHWL